MKKQIISLLVLLPLFLAACGGNAIPAPEVASAAALESASVIAEGRLSPVPSVELAFAQPGIVAEVFVRAGDAVKEGDIIARLENSDILQADVTRAEESFLLAEQNYSLASSEALNRLAEANEAVRLAQRKMDDFDIPSDLKAMGLQEALKHTLKELDEARAAYEPYRHIYNDKRYEDLDLSDPDNYRIAEKRIRRDALEAKRRLDDAWADYRKAIQWAELDAALQAARAELGNARKDFENMDDAQEMNIPRARYETAKANLAATRAALANAELRAPFAGTILSVDLTVGEAIQPGIPVVFIANTKKWQVETTDLAEIDISRVSLDNPVIVKLDAFPDEDIMGKVTAIDPVGREHLGDMTYKVTITLDEPDPRFLWNMTATVSIETE
jgi:HlyD family secretion protein